jgi:hypothetical protein
MKSRSIVAKLIGVALLLSLAIWWLRSYRISDYRGDGIITDAGTWNYPRYRIELGQIPFCEAGTHQFKLTGLPSEQMTLTLSISGKTDKDRAELTKSKTKIEASLVDSEGHTACKAFGIPSNGIQDNAWILASSETSAAFYHRACVDVDIQRAKSYILTVTVTDLDSDVPRFYVVPVLSGGGNELP